MPSRGLASDLTLPEAFLGTGAKERRLIQVSSAVWQQSSPVVREFILQHESAHFLLGPSANSKSGRLWSETLADLYAVSVLHSLGYETELDSLRKCLQSTRGFDAGRWTMMELRRDEVRKVHRLDRLPNTKSATARIVDLESSRRGSPEVVASIEVRSNSSSRQRVVVLLESGFEEGNRWHMVDYRPIKLTLEPYQTLKDKQRMWQFAAVGLQKSVRVKLFERDAYDREIHAMLGKSLRPRPR